MVFYKLIQLYACGLVLVSSSSINRLFYWQQRVASQEPLVRFPFTRYLVDPCGSTALSAAFSPVITDEPMNRNHLVGLFRSSFQDPNLLAYNYTREDRNNLAHEFWIVFNETRTLARRIYSPTALLTCQGIQLQSLPDISSLSSLSLRGVYRGLMITAAHLHMIQRDAMDSARNCPSESHEQHRNINQLSGKIETSMCLILQMGNNAEIESYLDMAYEVLQTVVYRYFECSARETRCCLVLGFINRILHIVENTGMHDEFRAALN